MNRRSFLKSTAALAVAGAFPLPATPAPVAQEIFFVGAGGVMFCGEQAFSRISSVWGHSFDEQWFCTACKRSAERIVDTCAACI